MWPVAHLLDAGCAIALDADPTLAREWAQDLHRVASSAGLQEHVVRALVWRSRLGDPGAAESAQLAAHGIDNPALVPLLATVRGRHG